MTPALPRGLPYVKAYIAFCGCACGCDVSLEVAGNGESYLDGRPAFEIALRKAGWLEPGGQKGPRWVCGGCGECGSEREAVA